MKESSAIQNRKAAESKATSHTLHTYGDNELGNCEEQEKSNKRRPRGYLSLARSSLLTSAEAQRVDSKRYPGSSAVLKQSRVRRRTRTRCVHVTRHSSSLARPID